MPGGGIASLHPMLAQRLAWRQFLRAPGSAVYAALTLAVGLGAATANYSVMRGFEAPLPVPDGEHVVQVQWSDPENGRSAISAVDFRAWADESRSLSRLGGFTTLGMALSTVESTTRMVQGAILTEEVFGLLRVPPLLGRLPTSDPADETAVVISHLLWQRLFDGDADVTGAKVGLAGDVHTIVGVMPPGFHFPYRQDLWLVRDRAQEEWAELEVVARLNESFDRTSAGDELTAIAQRTGRSQGAEVTGRAEVDGFTEERGEGGEETMLFGLLLMVLALVMVSCANVSNLLLERAAARARSLSVHQALGASPWQIVLQILTEALWVAALGVALGVVFAHGAVVFVDTTLADHWGYYWTRVAVDPAALRFACMLGVVTALVSGTVPAWRAMRADLAEPLQQESRSIRRVGKPWLSRVLITGQVACSCAAVIASVLMGLGLLDSRRVEEGFPADSVRWASVTFDGERYDSADARRAYRDSLLAALDGHAALRGAALSTGLPGLRSPFRRVTVDRRPPEETTRPVRVAGVTPEFFRVFGLRVLDGREFLAVDALSDVAIISEDFARNRLAGESAIGATLRLHSGGESEEVRVVGVVSNVVIYDRHRNRKLEDVYLPIAKDDAPRLFLTLRDGGAPSDVAAAVVHAARVSGPEVPIGELQPIADMLAYVRQVTETLGTLAILGGLGAVVVVFIGLYGLVAFDVRRRLPELAVRLALGAGSGRLLAGVLGQGFLLIVPGVAIGLGLTYLTTPLLGVFLGGTEAHDPRVFGGALAVYCLVALLASGLPASRAASCNPADVLRLE